jgi:hypothetical protein
VLGTSVAEVKGFGVRKGFTRGEDALWRADDDMTRREQRRAPRPSDSPVRPAALPAFLKM